MIFCRAGRNMPAQGRAADPDEIQTGFGRTGRFFACEHWGAIPDIITVAKAIGGGMPLGGFISRLDVMKTLTDPPLSHMTTFGGHPVKLRRRPGQPGHHRTGWAGEACRPGRAEADGQGGQRSAQKPSSWWMFAARVT